MTIKFKIQNGLRINTTDVLNSSADFIGSRLLPTSTDSSTSALTGALVVPGGAGIGENLFVGGKINNITLTPPATNATLTLGDNTTLNFPLSLSFPSTTGDDGYVLTTNGNGTLRWDTIAAVLNMPTASSTVLGGVRIGNGLNITNEGVLSAASGGNIDGGYPMSVYGGIPPIDGGGI